MSGKLRAFLGLNDSGDVVVESHRKRRTDYMKKIQRLVVPDDESEEAAPENIVTAPAEEAPAEPAPEEAAAPQDEEAAPEAPVEAVAEAPAAEKLPEEEPEAPLPRRSGRRYGESSERKEKKSFASRFFHMGDSLRRPAESTGTLILVKTGALEMLEDIEDALVSGQTVLIDFERTERKTAEAAITKLLNFIRLHKGAFYAVTRTSMLLSLRRDSVLEWRPGGDAGEQ
ncbi:MAG: hypothetical protein IJ822_08715 [Pyramidobacter sp.]|nr:hypothetical protein [Pyramidobacter sp.]MBR1896849.1 hypothetical protein [Pyramidobacter sp.]